MSLHGVKRSRAANRDSEAEAEARRLKEQARIKEYLGLTDELAKINRGKDYEGQGPLDLTTSILSINPEHPTAWSTRRRIFLQAQSPPSILARDLDLTQKAMRKNPKVYAVWEHRKWVMKQMHDEADWARELKTVEALLDKDGRNFHAWAYRRHLVAELSTPPLSELPPSPLRPKPTLSSELAFTTKHISRNFSNFSAWHHRSKVLTKVWEAAPEKKVEGLKQDLELVRQALYVDPADQSAWLYHRWLLSQTEDPDVYRAEIASINELLEIEPDSRWAVSALVAYDRRLLDLDLGGAATGTRREEVERVNRERLERMAELDPLRKERYQDLLSQKAKT